MRGVMHLIDHFRAGCAVPSPHDLRPQLDPHDGVLPLGIFLHVANRLILVGIEHELLPARDCEEGQHVTAR